MCENLPLPGGQRLWPGHPSLAHGVPASTAPGTIYALSVAGGVTTGPREGQAILFGRNRPEVHLCLGENDREVSRQHGQLIHYRRQWWVSTWGRKPLRLPDSRLLYVDDDPVPLAEGYTQLFVRGSGRREHLLELFVAGPEPRTAVRPGEPTWPRRVWRLDVAERLALTALAERYLRHERYAQPLTWAGTAKQLARLQPETGWDDKKVERLVAQVRARLSAQGVAGLTREEIGEPIGNMLNHNLIQELLQSSTLTPADLCLLDHAED